MTKKIRARIHSLVLVNWHGFFFQPFEMDGGVTALEGENGAGKTTVMIAAFVALLPDQRLLQFRNVSEAGGVEGDRGIFGRLGAKGVAYTVLSLLTPKGARILAGVMLRRKAPPSLELTPFIIDGLSHDLPLEEILLMRDGETERVPELSDLRQNVGALGGALTVCESVGRYTSLLFDLGVTPMRMEAYTERDKLNRMLQTSMYGGLSSSIQKGLRDYLLAEDPSLRNHVARMRENLDACRVTRQEIESADKRYKIIQGVFKSGYGMFEAAFHGTRLRVAGFRKNAYASRDDHVRSKSELLQVRRKWRDLERRSSEAKVELEARQKEHAEAEAFWAKCKQAREIASEIDRNIPLHLKAQGALEENRGLFLGLEKRFRECEGKRDRLFAEKEQNASGLADAQKAWEQVSKKAALYRQARESLEDARKALPDREVTDGSAAELLAECRDRWSRALETKTRIEQEMESLESRIRRYNEVLEILRQAAQRDVAPENALETARGLDCELREIARIAEESEALPARMEEAKTFAGRQREVRRKASLLAERGEKIEDAAGLRSLFESRHHEQESLAQERTGHQERLAALGEARAEAGQQLIGLQAEAAEWQEAGRLIRELEKDFAAAIPDGPALENLKARLDESLSTIADRLRRLDEERAATRNKALELEFGGGRLDESLVRLRDLVEGRLVAEFYDEVPEKDAALVEARLGPLHGALLVSDIPDAAQRIAQEPDRPDEVWLISAGALKELPEGRSYPAAELVRMGEASRLTRHPERPVVGRVAREREIDRLKARGEALLAEIESVRGEESRLQEGVKTIQVLSRYWRFLGAPDPAESTGRLQNRLKEITGEERRIRRRMQEIDLRLQHCREVLKTLTQCLPDADLLDGTDWSVTVETLRLQQAEAGACKQRLEALQPAMKRVRAGWLDLESPPPGPEEIQARRQALERAEAVLGYWSMGRDLLGTFLERLPHLSFADQEKLLAGQESALEALKAQMGKVDQAYQEAKEDTDKAGRDLEQARKEVQEADARFTVLNEKIESLRQDLARTGEDGSRRSLDAAERVKEDAGKKLYAANETERAVNNDLIRAEKDVEISENKASTAREKRKKDLEALWPHWRNWRNLRRRALREGLADRLLDPRVIQSYEQKGPPRAFEEASRHQGELKRILQDVPRGGDLWQEVEQLIESQDAEMRRGSQTLEVWLMIRRFLEQSIPRDIAQADDPEVALKQIEDHLRRLNGRLADQERQLRQRTDTVANSIGTRVRREERQIHRLNKGLEAVSFGTIAGLRIRLERVESMQRLLDGLKVQKELFNIHIPLEEAMAELYRQVGGGQVRGDQLLDYREYVRMSVEVQRLGSVKWTRAAPSTLSTGESIGVGAAVLMVILDAWEHQAVFLRGKRDGGSIRFLFLDEAARLSPRSLDTLGELCERMDLQLLVAAPAADRARRGTAYRLVRRLGEDGEEEVVVRGRRFTGQMAEV